MDELIRQGQWWWPFLVPVSTGLLALAGSWFGSKWGKTAEHKQWRRNQRQDAYLALFDAMGEYQTACNKVLMRQPDPQKALERVQEAADRLQLENFRYMALFPAEVLTALGAVFDASTKLAEAAAKGMAEGAEASREDYGAATNLFGSAVIGVRQLARQDLQIHREPKAQKKALAQIGKELSEFQRVASELFKSKK